MKRQLIIALTIFILLAGICSADNYVGGIPPTTIKEGEVSGGVYSDSYYGTDDQINYNPITIDKTFTLPDDIDIEWAMLLTTVYCGHMQNNYQGTAEITFNGEDLGTETLNIPFVYKVNGGDGYAWVNDHVVRVTSDYMMWYNVTEYMQTGTNTAAVHTDQINNTFDGRIKLISLIVAYNDDSGKTIYYWVNRGHDVDTYYSDSYLEEDYIGSTNFTASLQHVQAAHLTAVHMASSDGSYAFNGNSITAGTPQGTYCGSNTWDVTDSFDPEGMNTLTYDRTGPFYKIALGIITAEYQEEEIEPDLLISDITVKHNYYNGAWVNLSNSVNVMVVNNGADGAGSFDVALYADGLEVDTISVADLAAGASTVVSFDWIPDEVKTYTLRAEADTADAVAESDETNNNFTKSQYVGYNGYMGDKPLTTYAHDIITGDILFTHGTSFYSGKLSPGNTYTVSHDVTLPAGASVNFARLYNYWTWSAVGTTGKYPTMSLTFDGSTVSSDVKYDDRKGWGLYYDYPAGTWAYDVTSLVTGSGTYTTVVTNTDTEVGSYVCMDGLGLLVVYEDPDGQLMEYWINEGADMLSTMGTSGGLISDEATTLSGFNGPVDLSNVDSARLWTVVQSGGHPDNSLLFNSQTWTGVYDGTPYPDLDIDEARAVGNYLNTSDNTAMIRAAPYAIGGDYLMPSNAFLVINYSEMPIPELSVSAIDPKSNIFVDATNVFTVYVENQGTGNVTGSFDVNWEITDDTLTVLASGTETITGLNTGEEKTFDFEWKPTIQQDIHVTATADTGDAVAESNETNNDLSVTYVSGTGILPLSDWGYGGDEPLNNSISGDVSGDLIYTSGDSAYLGGNNNAWSTYEVNFDLGSDVNQINGIIQGVGSGIVQEARLYMYYTWYMTPLGWPEDPEEKLTMTFDGNPISTDAKYEDSAGFGAYGDYKYGTFVYDVTSHVTADGTYQALLTNNNTGDTHGTGIYGMALLVIYEDGSKPSKKYHIAEGFELLRQYNKTSGRYSYHVIPEDATSTFDMPKVGGKTIKLFTVAHDAVSSGDMSRLYFNNMYWSDPWTNGISILDVKPYKADPNIVKFQDRGDGYGVTNAILIAG